MTKLNPKESLFGNNKKKNKGLSWGWKPKRKNYAQKPAHRYRKFLWARATDVPTEKSRREVILPRNRHKYNRLHGVTGVGGKFSVQWPEFTSSSAVHFDNLTKNGPISSSTFAMMRVLGAKSYCGRGEMAMGLVVEIPITKVAMEVCYLHYTNNYVKNYIRRVLCV